MHQFYQNLSNKLNILSKYILVILVLNSTYVSAQGLLSNFDKLLNGQKDKFKSLTNTLINKEFDLADVSDIQAVSLDQTYLNLLIQNTPTRYMLLATNDRCSIYDLINTGLLRAPGGKVSQIIFKYKDSKGNIKKRILPTNIFFKVIANKQCPKLQLFKSYFNLKNVRNTLKKIRLGAHRSKEQCIQELNRFKNDLRSPYLCSIVEKVRSISNNKRKLNNLSKSQFKKRSIFKKEINSANSYQRIVSKKAREILSGYCLNLNNPKSYCIDYFKQSFWTKTHLERPNSEVLKAYCPQKRKRQCITRLNRNPERCHYAGEKLGGIFPKSNCNEISRALLNSKLRTQYQDCPSKTGNDAITTFARVLNHFENYLTNANMACELNSTFPVALLSEEVDDYRTWGIKLCFKNKLDGGKKVCHPTLLGDVKNHKLSLSNTVYKILTRLRGYTGSKCEVIPDNEYRPTLLKYRTGCYILTNPTQCTGVACDFKVILGGIEFKNYFVESELNFNLMPIDFINENKSLIKLYSRGKKKSLRSVKNISTLLNISKSHPKSVFVGIGCAEDILPSFFQRTFLNQCRPLPFVVDGLIEQDRIYSLVTRTSLDQINAPRIISWANIFSGLKQYKNLHPTGSWGFYAIY